MGICAIPLCIRGIISIPICIWGLLKGPSLYAYSDLCMHKGITICMLGSLYYSINNSSNSITVILAAHLLFLWQRELQILPAFLHAQLLVLQSTLQLHLIIP